MAGPRYKNSVFGKRTKKKPRITMKSSGRARPAEKTPIVNPGIKKKNMRKERIKIVPGFKSLINKRKERMKKISG